MMRKLYQGKIRDLLICLSLSNLTFLNVWNILVSAPYYEATKPPPPLRFMGFVLNVLFLGIIFWLGITLARRAGNPLWLKLAKCVSFAILVCRLTPCESILQVFHST